MLVVIARAAVLFDVLAEPMRQLLWTALGSMVIIAAPPPRGSPSHRPCGVHVSDPRQCGSHLANRCGQIDHAGYDDGGAGSCELFGLSTLVCVSNGADAGCLSSLQVGG